jgi:hypothetical protein
MPFGLRPHTQGSTFWVEKHPTNYYQRDFVYIVFVIPFHPMGDGGYY